MASNNGTSNGNFSWLAPAPAPAPALFPPPPPEPPSGGSVVRALRGVGAEGAPAAGCRLQQLPGVCRRHPSAAYSPQPSPAGAETRACPPGGRPLTPSAAPPPAPPLPPQLDGLLGGDRIIANCGNSTSPICFNTAVSGQNIITGCVRARSGAAAWRGAGRATGCALLESAKGGRAWRTMRRVEQQG